DPTYQDWVRTVMAEQDAFAPDGVFDARPDLWPPTRYEAKAVAAGRRPRWWRSAAQRRRPDHDARSAVQAPRGVRWLAARWRSLRTRRRRNDGHRLGGSAHVGERLRTGRRAGTERTERDPDRSRQRRACPSG